MNQGEIVLGVDTHLDTHVGAVISITGKLLATQAVETTASGYLQLLNWARSLEDLHRAGVEGTATYGSGLTRALRDNGIEVFEVNRPDRAARRLRGKADPTDAESAACAVLSARATAVPKEQSGAAYAMRAVSVARRSAVKARTQAINQLRGLLVSAPQEISVHDIPYRVGSKHILDRAVQPRIARLIGLSWRARARRSTPPADLTSESAARQNLQA